VGGSGSAGRGGRAGGVIASVADPGFDLVVGGWVSLVHGGRGWKCRAKVRVERGKPVSA
jgi:hypothetical protein